MCTLAQARTATHRNAAESKTYRLRPTDNLTLPPPPSPPPYIAGGDSNQSTAHKSAPSNCWPDVAMRARDVAAVDVDAVLANARRSVRGRLIYLHLATSTGWRARARLLPRLGSESVDFHGEEETMCAGLQCDSNIPQTSARAKEKRMCAQMCA